MKATLHAQFQKGENHPKYIIYLYMYINPYILEVTTSIFFFIFNNNK
jgi:hypothetical protein